MATTAFNPPVPSMGPGTPTWRGGLHSGDAANRYSGGTAGAETRYHQDAADCDRFDEATVGKLVKNELHGDVPSEEGATINTVASTRGKLMGARYGADKGFRGF